MDFSVLTEIYGHRADRYAEKVAVIGSGPAGLACAHDLALLGYPVTIFEAAPVAGGMLRLGVPEYRLPRALIQLEINAILSLGVELTTGVRLGHDFTLADLRDAGLSRRSSSASARCRAATSRCPGIELDGVLQGHRLPAQRQPRLQGRDGPPRRRHRRRQRGRSTSRGPRRAAASRRTSQRNLSVVQALDVARSAVRFGAREVTVCCLESESEMPASPDEVEEAVREGIRFRHRLGPKRLVGAGRRR